MLRSYYHGMLVFPMVWAICCWFALFCPLVAPLSELFMGQSEAYAIYIFLVIMYMLVSIEACKTKLEQSDPGQTSLRSEMENMGQTIMDAVHDYGPQKYFAVPPFGCCFKPCCWEHQITAKQLLWVSRLVKQYVILELFLNTFFMWAGLTFQPERAARIQNVAAYILKISGMMAVYGLFIMYKATHDLLHDWNTTRFRPRENSCLLTPGHPEELERIVVFWTTFASLMETVLLSHLIIRAFPAHEVADFPLKNLDLVELELRQIHERSLPSGLDSESSEDDEESK